MQLSRDLQRFGWMKQGRRNSMEQKKPTNAQLKKRIERAIVLIDRTRDTQEIYFFDKGLRLQVNEDVAIIGTNYHRHIFNSITSSGYSRPYLYTKRFVEIALGFGDETKVKTKDGWSYARLFDELKKREDKNDYNLCWYYDIFLYNIFAPLYGIGESVPETFLTYENYVHNIARNEVILSEKLDDMTNKTFMNLVVDKMESFVDDIEERVIFYKKTDEELVQEEIDALQGQEQEQTIEEE